MMLLDNDSSSGDADITEGIFGTLMFKDWLENPMTAEHADFQRAIGMTVYQVVNTRNVAISLAKANLCESSDESDADEKETDIQQYRLDRVNNRMLKLELYDGNNYHTAYEYEPIAALDVFYSTARNRMPVRCCGKIAIYNNPRCQRDATWLTQYNVKLLFEGYVCCLADGSNNAPNSHALCISRFVSSENYNCKTPNASIMHIGRRTESISFFKKKGGSSSSSSCFLDIDSSKINVKEVYAGKVQSYFDMYFPLESGYYRYSFVAYIHKVGLQANEISFDAFCEARVREIVHGCSSNTIGAFLTCIKDLNCQFFGDEFDLDMVNGNSVSYDNEHEHEHEHELENGVKRPRSSSSQLKLDFLESKYQYGILEHAIPIHIGKVETRERTAEYTKVLVDAIGSVEDCLNSQYERAPELWLVHFNKFYEPPFPCIIPLGAIAHCVAPLSNTAGAEESLLAMANKINSLQGFFRVIEITIEGVAINVITDYSASLSPGWLRHRAQQICEGYDSLLKLNAD